MLKEKVVEDGHWSHWYRQTDSQSVFLSEASPANVDRLQLLLPALHALNPGPAALLL